jgi:hypothetical protein
VVEIKLGGGFANRDGTMSRNRGTNVLKDKTKQLAVHRLRHSRNERPWPGCARQTLHLPSSARVYSTTSRICAVVRTPPNEGMVSSGLVRPFVTTAISSSMFGKSRVA